MAVALPVDSSLLRFLKTGEFSDFTIVCNDTEFKVHRTTVCGASPMLYAACTGRFPEAIDGTIKFPEQSATIMARVILFIYTGDYDPGKVPDFLIPIHNEAEDLDAMDQQKEEKEPPLFTTDAAVAHVTKEDNAKKAKIQEDTTVPKAMDSATGETTDPKVLRRLKVNALVYMCADNLMMENLRALAAERFLADARMTFTNPDFAKPLELMYKKTRPGDKHLRVPVTALCLKNFESLVNVPEVVDIVKESEHCIWDVSGALIKDLAGSHHEETKKLFAKMSSRPNCCGHYAVQYSVKDDGSVYAQCTRPASYSNSACAPVKLL